MMKGAVGLGALLLAAQIGALPWLLGRFSRSELSVHVSSSPRVAPDGQITTDSDIPADARARAVVSIDGRPTTATAVRVGPGLHRLSWKVAYRGGFDREVGVTELAGPFEDPAKPTCGIHLRLDRSLLDDGKGGDGTIAGLLSGALADQLAGQDVPCFGAFQKVASVSASVGRDPLALLERARPGFRDEGAFSVTADLQFAEGDLTVTIGIPLVLHGGDLVAMDPVVTTHSNLHFGICGILDFLSIVDINGTASSQVKTEAQTYLEGMWGFFQHPELPLDDTRSLAFQYCGDQPISIADGVAWISLAPVADPATIATLPVPATAVATPPPDLKPGATAPLALDVDLASTNVLLHEMWADGYLDDQLVKPSGDWFDASDPVTQYLSVRVAGAALSVPPEVEPAAGESGRLRLSGEASFGLLDGDSLTPARLFTRADFGLGTDSSGRLVPDLAVSELALTCMPAPGTFEPCYADLVAAAREHADDWQRSVSQVMADRFQALLERVPHFHTTGVAMHTELSGSSAWVQVALGGHIE